MAHQRKVIRDKVVELLIDGETAAEDRVFPMRDIPARHQNEMPLLAVYTVDETVDADSAQTAPRELTRNLSLVIEAWVTEPAPSSGGAQPTIDDSIDELALEVETIMHADPYLDGTVGESVLQSTEVELVRKGDRMLALAMLTYAVTYRTMAPEPVPDEELPDLRRMHAEYNVTGEDHDEIDPDREDTAHDDVVIQEEPEEPPPEEPEEP